MKVFPNNNQTQTIYNSMLASFSQTEVIELYFLLGIDSDNVPKPANKQTYIEYLMRFMASRNSQKALIAQLKHLRPEIDWPNTYTISTDILLTTPAKPIHFEQHIQEQHINIYPKPIFQRKPLQKNKRSSNITRQEDVEKNLHILFENVSRKVCFGTTAYYLLLVVFGLTAILFVEERDGISVLFSILVSIPFILWYVSSQKIYTHIFDLIMQTDYYGLSRVNDRRKVKESLLIKKGSNKVVRFISHILIKRYLEPDKNDANRRKA